MNCVTLLDGTVNELAMVDDDGHIACMPRSNHLNDAS